MPAFTTGAQAGTAAASGAAALVTVPLATTPSQVAAVEEYWKPDRLAKADDSTPKTADPKPAATSSSRPASGGQVASLTPVRAAEDSKRKVPWTVQPALPTKGGGTGSAPQTVGKVFFRTGGKEYWCSATSVRAQNRSLVATAGHCAFDVRSGKPVEYWVFVPNYKPGSQPDGIYVGHTLAMHSDFQGLADYDYDYAFIAVHRGFRWEAVKDAKGQTTYKKVSVGLLQDNVGGQGITAGRGATVAARAFGFPAGPQPDGSRPYNGHELKTCAGTTRKVSAPTYQVENGIAIKNCAFTAGASGGPWLVVYNSGTRLGFLNGINSLSWNRKADGKNDEISSSYFGAAVQVIYNRAQSVAIP
ncbi:hypothetical protein HNP84_002423 [Thermocatellispora tengchongensis]|uniref:Serine protease n=1 Tax=Thermocatellispora tengchongensis TaxID=1073253 RepID=A0A840P658_9ACTN|nr:serine protease [Thermocatellispora tengchongensis]MBB5132707.1 hypothetical protein [Thermocatellispora tengchongensis]